MYSERIFGTIYPTTAFSIRTSGDVALKHGRYKKCMELWLRSLEFNHGPRIVYWFHITDITEDLLFCVHGFLIMLHEKFLPVISCHFEWGIEQLKLAKERKLSVEDICYSLCRMLALWFLVVDAIPNPVDKQAEKERLLWAARQICLLMKGCSCSLLLACLSSAPDMLSAASSVAECKLPLHLVVELLIELGCSVNCEDSRGNYPLHLAVMLHEDSSLKCAHSLIESGAHVDAVNHFKQTPLDLARTQCGYPELEDELILYLGSAMCEHCSLQCLAAKALVAQEQNYIKILPPFLVSFVAQHESDEQGDTDFEDLP